MEAHLEALCSGLQGLIEVQVIAANERSSTEEERIGGVPVSRLGTIVTLASTPICPSMVFRIRAASADVVHIHLPNPAAVLAYLASRHPGRLVITYHSDVIRQKFLGAMFEPIVHAILERSAAIIATSANYLHSSHVLSRHVKKCRVIPFGIHPGDFERPDPDAILDLRERYGSRIVLGVGRLVYYKGFEYLVRAMTRVSGTLLLVGDGPLRPSLEKLAASLGLHRRVIFCGEVYTQTLVAYYHAASLLVLSSIARSEAFGIVQLEAMACGKPIVNTSLDSGVPFVSLDGVTGFTVPPADPVALAGAIGRLLDNPGLCRQFGEAARLRVRNKFSVELMVRRVARLYHEVLGTIEENHADARAVSA